MTGRAAALHAHSGSQGVLPLVPDYQAGKACGEPSEFLMPESEYRKKEPFPCLLYAIATGRPETGRLLGSGWPCGWLWPMVRVGRCGTSMGLKTPGTAPLAASETRATTPRWASPGECEPRWASPGGRAPVGRLGGETHAAWRPGHAGRRRSEATGRRLMANARPSPARPAHGPHSEPAPNTGSHDREPTDGCCFTPRRFRVACRTATR